MHFEDTTFWPDIPVEEIDRGDVETLFSFGHNDGPASGLIRWRGELWYVDRFSEDRCKFWIVQLTKQQQEYAQAYGTTWAEYFHTGMSWNPDGTPVPQRDGIYAVRPTPAHLTMTDEGRAAFRDLFPDRPRPDDGARIVGFFRGWRLS